MFYFFNGFEISLLILLTLEIFIDDITSTGLLVESTWHWLFVCIGIVQEKPSMVHYSMVDSRLY